MGIADRERLLAFFRAGGPPPEATDIAAKRARIDALSGHFRVPESTRIEPAVIGGVPGEWVGAPGLRHDAVLIFLHGGAYVIGSPLSHRHLVAAIGAASGMPVFAADYRLAPEHRFPAAVDDALSVYKGVIASGTRPAKIAVIGDSAGGGLAIAMLLAARAEEIPMPACAAAISPWADLTQSSESHRTRAHRDRTIVTDNLNVMAAAYLDGEDATNPLASPVFADLHGLPPLLLQVGTEEVLYDDTRALQARAEEAGVEVSMESWGGMIHAWHLFHPLLSEGRCAIERVGAFVTAHVD